MKKHLFLLPLLMLAISGCSEAGDPTNSGSTSGSITSGSISGLPPVGGLVEKLNALANVEECQISVTLDLTIPSTSQTIPTPGGLIELPVRYSKEHVETLSYVKNQNTCVDYSSMSGNGKKYFYYADVNEVLENYSMTIDNLKEMVATMPEEYGTVEFHDEEGYAVWTSVVENDSCDCSVVRYDSEINQYMMADFYNGKPVNAEYIMDYEMESDHSGTMKRVVELLKSNLASLTLVDGLYTLDTTNSPIKISGGLYTKAAFSYGEDTYHVELDGYSPLVIDDQRVLYHEELDIHHIGNTGYTIPTFEVKCPYNHACHRVVQYDETHHIQVCAHCGRKIDGAQPVEHVMSEEHGFCLACLYGAPSYTSYFSDERLELGKNYPTLSGILGNNGNIYEPRVSGPRDIDEEKYGNCHLYFWVDQEIMILEEQYEPTVINGSEWSEEKKVYYCYKGFQDLLTAEQKAAIEEHKVDKSYVISVYREALNIPETFALFIEQFAEKLLVKYVGYNIDQVHDETLHHVDVNNQDLCFAGSYNECLTCGQTIYKDGYYHHEYTYTQIETPSWGQANAFWYFTVSACAHCGAEDPFIYVVPVNPQHEIHCDAQRYFNDGHVYPYGANFDSSISIPHNDNNHDGRCDICGAYRLSGTVKEEYSMYFRYGQNLSSSTYWTLIEQGLVPETTNYRYVYQNVAHPTILMEVIVVISEEEYAYHYSINGGEEQIVHEEKQAKV